MAEAEDFSYGSYGDYSGVTFYGPPAEGFWFDRLPISDRYVTPLFSAVLDRSQTADAGPTPQLVRDWAALQGWIDTEGIVEVARQQALELLHSLESVTAAEVSPYCAGSTPDECVRCSAAIRHFLGDRLARGLCLFIEKQ
jgi:hypothetical protein